MRRTGICALIALVGLAAASQADPLSCHHCITRCMVPPPPKPPCCPPPPCEHRWHLTLFDSAHARYLIAALASEDACIRRTAVKKLGCRLHADFCCTPEVLDALLGSLQCDTCWEVRRAAAWSILGQNAYTNNALLALYVSSKLDPHYLVRIRANEAFDILTVGYPECYKPLVELGTKLAAQLKAKKYVPGTANCRVLFDQVCASCGISTAPQPTPEKTAPQRPEELAKPRSGPTQPPEELRLPKPGPERAPEELKLPKKGSKR